jgi:hypothetical protein
LSRNERETIELIAGCDDTADAIGRQP